MPGRPEPVEYVPPYGRPAASKSRRGTIVNRTLRFLAAGALCAAATGGSLGAQAPLTQTAYIKASNPAEGNQFGYAVAVSGDGNTMAVSSPFENSGATGVNGNQKDNSKDDSGAVYV